MWQSLSRYGALALESAAGVFGVRLYEEPAWQVIDRVGARVEVRRYAARLAVEAKAPATGRAGRDEAFQLLFDYIAGDNRTAPSRSDRIAMTTPVMVREPERVAMTATVRTAESGGAVRLQFFLPAKYSLGTAPQPIDARVRLVPVPEETIAALRYSGSGDAAGERQAELLTLLAAGRWRPAGEAYSLFYDPPFALPPLRRNEAAVAVAPTQ